MIEQPEAAKLGDAARRLGAKDLLQPGDSLSLRLAGTGNMLVLTAETSPNMQPNLATVALSDGDTTAAAPIIPHLARHYALYHARADVGAVLLNRQPWAGALYTLGNDMPGVFDEQIRHLGKSVARLSDAGNARDALNTPASRERLRSGANAFVMAEQVLCLGMTLERVIFNAELLEKCAKAYVLAYSSGMPVGKIPWLVRWIANGRLMKDEMHAAAQYANGQTPAFSSAY